MSEPPDYLELDAVLQATIVYFMDAFGTDPEHTTRCLCEDRPDLEARYGRERIEARARELWDSEITELSAVYQALFDTFNARYFEGRLPAYRVAVVFSIKDDEQDLHWYKTVGKIFFQKKLIRLRLTYRRSHAEAVARGQSRKMLEILLHEMAHAAMPAAGHDWAWQQEMIALWRRGAPVDLHSLPRRLTRSFWRPLHPKRRLRPRPPKADPAQLALWSESPA